MVLLFHSQLSDAYSKVDVSTPQAKRRYSYMFQNLNVLASGGIVLLIRLLNRTLNDSFYIHYVFKHKLV